MRLAIFSDLHGEFVPFEPPPAVREADVVVLAGDIHVGVKALETARVMFPTQRIVQVAGNHEFFHDEHDRALDAMREKALRLQIDFLERDAVRIDGVEFFGTTLWTDYALYARSGQPVHLPLRRAIRAIHPVMADYRRIDCGARRLRAMDTIRWHRAGVAWLESRLLARDDKVVDRPPRTDENSAGSGLRVVVTHHLPSARSVSPAYATSYTNPAFASHLDHLVDASDLWVHGHTHASFDYRIGRGRVICNPRGYRRSAGVWENPAFDPCRLITLPEAPTP